LIPHFARNPGSQFTIAAVYLERISGLGDNPCGYRTGDFQGLKMFLKKRFPAKVFKIPWLIIIHTKKPRTNTPRL
jgi:hypothetical protein